jgi:hypothetical protein
VPKWRPTLFPRLPADRAGGTARQAAGTAQRPANPAAADLEQDRSGERHVPAVAIGQVDHSAVPLTTVRLNPALEPGSYGRRGLVAERRVRAGGESGIRDG